MKNVPEDKKKYITEEQADQVIIKENGLYRKWYQIEIPIRQDIADQLMDYEGSYKNGDKEVKLKGESLYYCFSRLCRLIDYKNIDNANNKKSYKVYDGYNDEKIAEKLKIGNSKWDAIKKVFYNAGLIEIIKRTYVWYENGIKRNGTKNIYVINRIPMYANEQEYCTLNWNWRNYEEDKKNKALSSQFIKAKPKAFINNDDEVDEIPTVGKTEKEEIMVENPIVGIPTMENPTMGLYSSPYTLLSSHFISSQSISLDDLYKEGKTDIDINMFKKIIQNCELDNIGDINISNAIKVCIQNLYFNSNFIQKHFKVPISIIKENLLYLNFDIINYAIEKMQQQVINGNKIKSPSTYLTICIYNSISEYYASLMTNPILLEEEKKRRAQILEEWKREISEISNNNETVYKEECEKEELEKIYQSEDIFLKSIKGTELEKYADNIRHSFEGNIYSSFICKLKLENIENKTAYFITSDDFIKSIVESRYKEKLINVLNECYSGIESIHIVYRK